MSRRKYIFIALAPCLALLAAAIFFVNQDSSVKADLQKFWLTIDVNELRHINDVAGRSNRPLNLEPAIVQNGIAVVYATEDQIVQVSQHSHEEFHKCAGFMAHLTEAEALKTIANFASVDNNFVPVNYTINNAATVQTLMSEMQASNIIQTINGLTSFTTRYHLSPTGQQSAAWIKDQWTALASGRSDVTVQFVQHPTNISPQPSVVLTITGTTQPNEFVILGGHQDSTRSGCSASTTCQTLPAPGADDDASGIASLTEVIRMIMQKNYRPAKTVQFMAYAAEEVGLRGSNAIAANYQSNQVNVIGVMQLDMTNYKQGSSVNDIVLVTDFTNAAQNQFLRDLRAAYLPTLTMANTTCGYACSDHASWNNRGYPASFPHEATLSTSNPTIHTANDTLANSDTTGTHALKFSRLSAAYIGELAKGEIVPLAPSRARADFDGDGRTDISVFRPSEGGWYINTSGNGGFRAQRFGLATDKLTPGDYDGDGKTDIAVFREGVWHILKSATDSYSAVTFGLSDDITVPGDYDGDGKTDVAVFRPSNGYWYILKSGSGFDWVQFGQNGDKPVPGDYVGNGKTSPAIFRPSNGTWYTSTNPATNYGAVQFGLSTDKLVPADYDGDGKTDVAVYRGGTWYILGSQTGFRGYQFGNPTDIPAVGDFDGDGKSDIAVYRQGIWYSQQSNAGFRAHTFGAVEDKPIPTAYMPE